MSFSCSKLFSISNNINKNNLNDTFKSEKNFNSLESVQLITSENGTKSNSLLNNSFGQQSAINKINNGNTTDSNVIFPGNGILSSEQKININNLSNMFNGCTPLKSLSGISNWDTSNVIDMSNMFCGCDSLESLPDISKLDTSNVTDMSNMFSNCKSLIFFPDISKWNISNVTNISGFFMECNPLLKLPDISYWDISKVTNISKIFYECNAIKSLPDISKWNTSQILDMNVQRMYCIKIIT